MSLNVLVQPAPFSRGYCGCTDAEGKN